MTYTKETTNVVADQQWWECSPRTFAYFLSLLLMVRGILASLYQCTFPKSGAIDEIFAKCNGV
jgi:hypothetical protein